MRKLFIPLIFTMFFIVFSCQSNIFQPHRGLWNTEMNIKKVQKGMSYGQVLSIMGEDYSATGTSEGADGQTYQTLKYNSTGHFTYVFRFKDNILIDWVLDKKPVNTLP